MLGARVHKVLVVDLVGDQGRLVRGPAVQDALVLFGIMDQQRGLDFRDFGRRGLRAIERHRRSEPRQLGRQVVGDAAAVAEAHHADLAIAVGVLAQDAGRLDEVGARFDLVELGEQGACLVLVAGVAAQREQGIGREGDEIVERHAARNVFDVRVEAPVFVHHQHGRQLAFEAGRLHQVAAQLAVTVG